MADLLPDEARVNSVTSQQAKLRAAAAARRPQAPVAAAFTTLPDGTVLDHAGRIIYQPPRKEVKP